MFLCARWLEVPSIDSGRGVGAQLQWGQGAKLLHWPGVGACLAKPPEMWGRSGTMEASIEIHNLIII